MICSCFYKSPVNPTVFPVPGCPSSLAWQPPPLDAFFTRPDPPRIVFPREQQSKKEPPGERPALSSGYGCDAAIIFCFQQETADIFQYRRFLFISVRHSRSTHGLYLHGERVLLHRSRMRCGKGPSRAWPFPCLLPEDTYYILFRYTTGYSAPAAYLTSLSHALSSAHAAASRYVSGGRGVSHSRPQLCRTLRRCRG